MFKISKLEDSRYDRGMIKVTTKEGMVSKWSDFLSSRRSFGEIMSIGYGNSKNSIKLPMKFSPDLAYLLGALIGDGCVQGPIKRGKGGRYWRISFSGEMPFLRREIYPLFLRLFGHQPRFTKKKNRERSWHMNIDSVIIYRFFNRVLGVPYGEKKNLSRTLRRLSIPRRYFKYFLAGLMDTDGHVSNYVNLTQKDKLFLSKIMYESRNILGIDFKGPHVNKKVLGVTVAWCLTIHSKSGIKDFISIVPLRYKQGPVAQLG